MLEPETVREYSPRSQMHHLPDVVRSMVRGIRKGWYIAYRLTLKDIRNEYSKSLFGFLWDLADPLVLGTIFYFLQRNRTFVTGDPGMPYSVYIVLGLLIYLTFCEATLLSTRSIERSGAMLKQLLLPPEALILSVLFRVHFNAIFRIVVITIFAVFADAFSFVGFLKFLAFFPALILAGMAVGVFLAPFNVLYADVGRGVQVMLTPIRYLSPVLFVIPPDTRLGTLNLFNPVALILGNLRLLITQDSTEHLMSTVAACCILLIVGVVGWFLFHLSIPILADRA